MIGVVVSRADEASEHVGEHLLDLADWGTKADATRPEDEGGGTYYTREGFELRTFADLHLSLDDVADAFVDPEYVVFVSRHAGDTGPLLTAHFTGNLGPAEYGGADGELARACPNAHDRVLNALREHAPEGYDVGMECTHHGPSSVGAPSMFVEVGSAEEQWRDPEAARAVAEAVLDLDGTAPTRERTVVGFGGGHYAPRFERIARETDWAIGHVAADWGIEAMADLDGDPRDVIAQVFVESGATRAIVDGDYPAIETAIDDLGHRVVSEMWVRETEGVPLDLVETAESAFSTIEDGLRFGDPARKEWAGANEPSEFEVYEPDPDLLADVHGTDPEKAREAVAAHALAYETDENGNRVTGRIAHPEGSRDALIDAVIDVLAERFETVECEDGSLVATERVFDPETARELGVPEGPAFGRLSNGQTVEVDGETIEPDEVTVERERRYRL